MSLPAASKALIIIIILPLFVPVASHDSCHGARRLLSYSVKGLTLCIELHLKSIYILEKHIHLQYSIKNSILGYITIKATYYYETPVSVVKNVTLVSAPHFNEGKHSSMQFLTEFIHMFTYT